MNNNINNNLNNSGINSNSSKQSNNKTAQTNSLKSKIEGTKNLKKNKNISFENLLAQ